MRVAGTAALLGAALLGVGLVPGVADVAPTSAAAADRARAPEPKAPPVLAGKYRTTLRVKSGGKPFGQKRGDVVNRTWSFKERCGDTRPCDVVKLIRKGRKGRFGSKLRRRGEASWQGVETVRGRCGDGLKFRTRTRIELRAVDYRGSDVAEFTGTFDAKVKGCVNGRERATLRGRLR